MKASIHHFSIPRNKHSIHTPESDLPLPTKKIAPPHIPSHPEYDKNFLLPPLTLRQGLPTYD